MSDYYGYVSVDALMEFAHNHVNGMIDSNDIARFPKANVKDANEQQSLQEIFGIPFARLRELATADAEGRIVITPDCRLCERRNEKDGIAETVCDFCLGNAHHTKCSNHFKLDHALTSAGE